MASYIGFVSSSIVDYGDTFTAGVVWEKLNGRRLKKADYPDLARLMGSTWGGVGSDYFTLPDFTSRAAIGAGTEFKHGQVIQDTTQRVTGYMIHNWGLNPPDGPSGAFYHGHNTWVSFPYYTPAPSGNSAIVRHYFDNARQVRTSNYNQTRGLAVWFYVFAKE